MYSRCRHQSYFYPNCFPSCSSSENFQGHHLQDPGTALFFALSGTILHLEHLFSCKSFQHSIHWQIEYMALVGSEGILLSKQVPPQVFHTVHMIAAMHINIKAEVFKIAGKGIRLLCTYYSYWMLNLQNPAASTPL